MSNPLWHTRKYWEVRASKLPSFEFGVGRTDMRSYNSDGVYVHYCYPPDGYGERIGFTGGEVGALRKAVLYAEKMNRKHFPTGPRKA